jgi:hypothetical protein
MGRMLVMAMWSSAQVVGWFVGKQLRSTSPPLCIRANSTQASGSRNPRAVSTSAMVSSLGAGSFQSSSQKSLQNPVMSKPSKNPVLRGVIPPVIMRRG